MMSDKPWSDTVIPFRPRRRPALLWPLQIVGAFLLGFGLLLLAERVHAGLRALVVWLGVLP